MVKCKIEQIETLIDKLSSEDQYFFDFINTSDLQAGILKVSKKIKDTQQPHPVDELYYVIRGSGYIQIEGNNNFVKEGSIIFVPANIEHKFLSSTDLVVLYILGST
jgi:mannose-6-phosphate isomerase-like protein (cupin superfamily)